MNQFTRRLPALLLALVFSGSLLHRAPAAPAGRAPNIVLILADDLGYGDLRCFNPASKIPTPHIDRLADAGMVFTDAHSSSAVCTPTRYGLMTGRYNWRSRLKNGVQGGMSPPLIEPGRLTIARFLQQHGYRTACFGKWHLGFDWPRLPGTQPFTDGIEKGEDGWRVDFTRPFTAGPTAFGFDEYFGIAASLDMVPYTFLEGDRAAKIPTTTNAFVMMHGRTNRFTRRGPAAENFDALDVLPALTRRAERYIEERAPTAKSGKPFFLYLPLAAPHTPIVPTADWLGRSGLNPYADFVMQTDAAIGRVLDALKRHSLTDSTLVIVTSDNGCSPEAGYPALLAKGHNPSGPWRGTKADAFEGGHRVPFIVRWPGRVKAASRSSQLLCLNDLFATCADILATNLPPNAAEDSISFLPALDARRSNGARTNLVHHSINGTFAVREGDWKLILGADSGGWSEPRPGSPKAKTLTGYQLYNLAADPGETNNLTSAQPRIVESLTRTLERFVAEGRSTPGSAQTNTTPVDIRPPAQRTARRNSQP